MIEKHRWYKLFALIPVIFLMMTFPSFAALTQIQIEQVKVVYPQLTMYYYEQTPGEVKEMKGYLGDEQLQQVTEEKIYGTDYYILLDISGSLKEADFISAKKEINSMLDELAAEDSLVVISFGDEVTRQFRIKGRDETAIQNAKELMEGLNAKDQTTHLYKALQEAITLSKAVDTGLNRQIMFVISDGADVSTDHVTLEETEAEVQSAGIPIYALCTSNAETAKKEDFGKLARDTGGTFTEFQSENAEEQWNRLKEILKSCEQITFTAGNSGNPPIGTQNFVLQVGTEERENYTIPVSVQTWEKDTEPPEVIDAVFMPDDVLYVQYSETMIGADQPTNYQLTDANGQKIAVSSVEHEMQSDGTEGYLLLLQEIPGVGEAVLDIDGSQVTDTSMERNPVNGNVPVMIFEAEEKEEFPWLTIILIGGGIVALAGILFGVFLLIGKKKKEPQTQTVEHIVHHIPAGESLQVQASGCAVLFVHMTGKDGRSRSLELPVNKSAIVGRTASQCEICMEDEKVSRQHCVFDERPDGIYLRDLNSRNGTFVNGIRLENGTERRISVNDMLRIGDTVLRIDRIRLKTEGSRNG